MYFGRWFDLYQAHMKYYNFTLSRKMYNTNPEDEPVSTLDAI